MEIKKYPHPVLRKVSKPVKELGAPELKLFEDMASTMYAFSGIGLAAPQVGIARQLIIADIGEGIIKLANPELIRVKGKDKMAEGCLSIPGVNVEIKRPYEVTVKGLNEKGELIEVKVKGLLARVLQHEIDHLKGRLIIDYVSLLRKMMFLKYRAGRKITQ